MEELEKQVPEVILESYNGDIDKVLKKMTFHYFENKKPYSFDYWLKSDFDKIIDKLEKILEKKKLTLSPRLSNKLPVFLPSKTKRIAFFSYDSKSVRKINTDEFETILRKQAEKRYRNGRILYEDISKYIQEDLTLFNEYHKKHNFYAYRRDISVSTIQFNAYDENDNLLVEKSFVKGGLVFDMDLNKFSEK